MDADADLPGQTERRRIKCGAEPQCHQLIR
jgi:hypothetical protein